MYVTNEKHRREELVVSKRDLEFEVGLCVTHTKVCFIHYSHRYYGQHPDKGRENVSSQFATSITLCKMCEDNIELREKYLHGTYSLCRVRNCHYTNDRLLGLWIILFGFFSCTPTNKVGTSIFTECE